MAEAAEKASIAQGVAMEAQAKVAPAREEEMIAAAVLRKLEGVRVGLERDLKDADDVIARLGAEAERLAADQAREERFRRRRARWRWARLDQERGALAASEDEPRRVESGGRDIRGGRAKACGS